MRKLILSILLGSTISFAFAQKSEIADAKKGWTVFQAVGNGLPLNKKISSLQEALGHATTATANEKTKDSPEAWTYRALLASSIAMVDTVNTKNVDSTINVAQTSVVEAKKLDTKGEFKDLIKSSDENITNAVKNAAFLAYQHKDLQRAYDNFYKAQIIDPNDTAMVLNASVLAKNLENYPKALELSRRLVAMNHPQTQAIYGDIINIELKNLKDTAAAIASLEEAKAKFPDNIDFITTATDMYIKRGNTEKAESSLITLVAKDPKNALYQAALGNVYLQQAYAKQNEIAKIDQVKNKAVYTKTKAERDALVDKAMPFYVKAESLDPKNLPALEGLKTIYFFKNDTKNYDIIKQKLKAAGATD